MKPRVTIGVCVRNCEEYVGEAVESILEQDFPPELMELIFVNDGSEDNTLSVIEKHVSKINIPAKVFHTEWKGLGHARNIVATNAEGDFILWVDGDMILAKDFVRKLATFMDVHREVGIAKGQQALGPRSNLLSTLETYSRVASRMIDYRSDKARSKALGTGGSIYRIQAIKQVGGFDENLIGYGEDFDIETRVRANGWSLCTTDAKFLDYERHGLTWKRLWSRYWHRGYHSHYFLHKNRGLLKHSRIIPPAAFLSGLIHANRLFKTTREKAIFLLPFQYVFKMSAWYLGFLRSHLNSYRPRS